MFPYSSCIELYDGVSDGDGTGNKLFYVECLKSYPINRVRLNMTYIYYEFEHTCIYIFEINYIIYRVQKRERKKKNQTPHRHREHHIISIKKG